jgi:hypothetical protein
MKRSYLLVLIAVAALVIGACSSDDTTTTTASSSVTLSGTMTWALYSTGDYIAVAFPQGTDPSSTGDIGNQTVTGTGTTADFSFTVPVNSGNVYVFGWNDSDGSTDPTAGEGGGCSTLLDAGSGVTAVSGIDITFVTDGWMCPSP